jgi:hypothetical protein
MISPIYHINDTDTDTDTECSTIVSDIENNINIQEISMERPNEKNKEFIFYLFLISCPPIAILDLIYAYKNHSCSDDYIQNINISINNYLLLTGYIEIILLSTILVILSKSKFINTIILPVSSAIWLFLVIWNIIIGIIIIMNGISFLEEMNCDDSIVRYLMGSLIYKLISSCIAIIYLLK